jgi:hypothetical protein
MGKKKNKVATGNEEIQQIMDEIKNAPKGNGSITIDTDQKQDDGSNVHEHTEIGEGKEIHTRQVETPVQAKEMPKSDVVTIDTKTPAVVPDESFKVFNLMNEGYTEPQLREMFKGWKLKKLNAVIKKAKDMMAVALGNQEEQRAEAVAKYKHLYKLSMEIGNIKQATQVLDSLVKVQGLTRDISIDTQVITMWGNK